MIGLAVAFAAIGALALCLVRLVLGPTLYDRVVAVNATVLLAAVAAAALSVSMQDPRGVDVSVALVICVFVANVALFKFSSARTFQAAIAGPEEMR